MTENTVQDEKLLRHQASAFRLSGLPEVGALFDAIAGPLYRNTAVRAIAVRAANAIRQGD